MAYVWMDYVDTAIEIAKGVEYEGGRKLEQEIRNGAGKLGKHNKGDYSSGGAWLRKKIRLPSGKEANMSFIITCCTIVAAGLNR